MRETGEGTRGTRSRRPFVVLVPKLELGNARAIARSTGWVLSLTAASGSATSTVLGSPLGATSTSTSTGRASIPRSENVLSFASMRHARCPPLDRRAGSKTPGIPPYVAAFWPYQGGHASPQEEATRSEEHEPARRPANDKVRSDPDHSDPDHRVPRDRYNRSVSADFPQFRQERPLVPLDGFGGDAKHILSLVLRLP